MRWIIPCKSPAPAFAPPNGTNGTISSGGAVGPSLPPVAPGASVLQGKGDSWPVAFDFRQWWEPEPLVWVPDEWSKILVGNRHNGAPTKVLSIFVGRSRLLFPLHANMGTTVLSLGVFVFALNDLVAQTHTHTHLSADSTTGVRQSGTASATPFHSPQPLRSSQPTPTPIAVPPEILSACFLLFPLESFFFILSFHFSTSPPPTDLFLSFHTLTFIFFHSPRLVRLLSEPGSTFRSKQRAIKHYYIP